VSALLRLGKTGEAMRIGHGYDVHRLEKGRHLILGGVHIPFEKGLAGHSDADVLSHAVMDALLGAGGFGDIGQMFPDTDEKYKDADSLKLLRLVGKRLFESGYSVSNIDATIVAQSPKLLSYMPQMRENIASALGLALAGVNIKATTEEHLGFTGTGQGIAVHCVVLINN
jgi:2-C-methyl-D-erythritol 2,4-cyclodiphosphate synthase